MAYGSVQVPGFSGLNLRDQPDRLQGNQATDLLNVTFTDLGGMRSRDGYAALTTSEGTNRYDSLGVLYATSGTKHLVAGAGNRLDAISNAGSVVASSTSPTASPHFFTRFGGPGAELVYCANGTDQLRTWNGTAFATPTWTGTAPTGKFVAVTPWDNRLVNARRSGTTGGDNPSSVRFSDPGAPNTWGSNNYVDLDPGDGEEIKGIIRWQSSLFVFKESKFYRFYSTDTDGAGQPVFRYTTVDTGVGLCSSKALCAGRDGVYFLSRNGVYRTDGGAPELASAEIGPLFTNQGADFYTGGLLNLGALDQPAMCFHREQVYLTFPSGTSSSNDRVLVFDPRYGWWSLYDMHAAALVSFRASSGSELAFAYASGLKHVGRHSGAYTTDAGSTIVSHYMGAWSDWGAPDVKTVRESKVWGRGKLRLGLGSDYRSGVNARALEFTTTSDTWGDGTGADTWGDGTEADTWGGGNSLDVKLSRVAARGTVFRLEVTNTDSTPWMLGRVSHHVREQRVPNVVNKD